MKSISVLNFTGVYERESFYKDGDCEWIDCSDLSGVNGFCDEASRRRLMRDQRAGRLDSFIDGQAISLLKLSHGADETYPGAVYSGGVRSSYGYEAVHVRRTSVPAAAGSKRLWTPCRS